MLSPTQLKAREGKLTASAVSCLMTGDQEKILSLWRLLTGDPGYEEPSFSDIWAIQLGSHTEPLNLEWYTRRVGHALSRHGEVVVHPKHDWAACTLDAWDDVANCPVEAKHCGGFEKLTTILERYAPQAHWQMIATGARQCIFTIIEGAREPSIETMPFNGDYAAELWLRAEQFMGCVFSLSPPVTLAPVAAPVVAEKIYQMQGNNKWASEAVTWITTRQARKDNEAADKAIKQLVPADAARCFGHGISVARSKSGALTIRDGAKE